MQLHITFNHEKYTDEELRNSIVKILSANNTLALSTVKDETGYINTAHYGFSEDLEFFIITDDETQHSINAQMHPLVGIAIWNRPTQWGTNLEGLQLFGKYEQAVGEDVAKGFAAYAQHISAMQKSFKTAEEFTSAGLTFYKITVEKIKLLDEPQFGRRNFIELVVTR